MLRRVQPAYVVEPPPRRGVETVRVFLHSLGRSPGSRSPINADEKALGNTLLPCTNRSREQLEAVAVRVSVFLARVTAVGSDVYTRQCITLRHAVSV